MPMITELQDEVTRYEGLVNEAMEANDIDKAHERTGYLAALRDQLNAEARRVEAENIELASRAEAVNASASMLTLGQRVLGPENAFNSIESLNGRKVRVENAATVLRTPTVEDNNLPALVTQPMGFIDTIVNGTTTGIEQYFLQPKLTNGAATWTIGQNKAESAIEWPEHTSNLETIAHWIPVHKLMARRYATLQSQIDGALMTGLKMVRNYKCIFGDNSNGIIGAANFPGINTWTKSADLNIVDNLADMAARCRVTSGYAPNYVALSPDTIREIAKTKDANGNYLFPAFKAGDIVPGTNMTAVEDVTMDVSTVADNTVTTKHAALVYYAGVIAYKAADNDAVEVGLVDKQFIQNAYTLLAEGTGLLRIDAPSAVCYCAELGTTTTAPTE